MLCCKTVRIVHKAKDKYLSVKLWCSHVLLGFILLFACLQPIYKTVIAMCCVITKNELTKVFNTIGILTKMQTCHLVVDIGHF